jgi:hypothetical protein
MVILKMTFIAIVMVVVVGSALGTIRVGMATAKEARILVRTKLRTDQWARAGGRARGRWVTHGDLISMPSGRLVHLRDNNVIVANKFVTSNTSPRVASKCPMLLNEAEAKADKKK